MKNGENNLLEKKTKMEQKIEDAGQAMSVSAVSSGIASLPTFTQTTAPMIGAGERQRLHHLRMPFPSAGGYASFAG